ncbi:hypothetical protein [Armatimonas sp.]|uniref:hypothetical protein n=1 Tax=Armatimonas sp. TaxID=1872638 RepID=UPI0037517D8F
MKQILRCTALGVVVCLAGCRGNRGVEGPGLDVMVPLVTAQIGETLLGAPSRSLSTPAEPPILGAEGRNQVVLAADEAAFVAILGEGARVQDVRNVVGKVSGELNKTLRRRKLTSVATGFPPTCTELDAARTVLASVFPFTLETGGPDDKSKGKTQTLLMVRLALTNAKTGQSLAIREFYSGYTLLKPRASR